MKKPLSMTPDAIASRKYRANMEDSRKRNKAHRTKGKKPPAPSVRKSWHDPREVGRKGATPWNDKAGLAHAMEEIGPDNDTAHHAGIPTDNAGPFGTISGSQQGVLHDPYPTGLWPPFTREDDKPFIDPNPGPRRDRSEIVADMVRQRNARKMAGLVEGGIDNPVLYSAVSQDAAKLRECLAECAKIVADAIVKGAKIIAGKEDVVEIIQHDCRTWNPVGPGTPLGVWLQTAQIIPGVMGGTTTMGLNTCMCRVLSLGDEPEWIEKGSGVTTVTHSTFAAPTHWRWIPGESRDKPC